MSDLIVRISIMTESKGQNMVIIVMLLQVFICCCTPKYFLSRRIGMLLFAQVFIKVVRSEEMNIRRN